MIIKTKTRSFVTIWDGVSDIDGLLRFQTSGGVMQELLSTFTDEVETYTLKMMDDNITVRSYVGYTDFYGIVKNDRGFIITLRKGESS